MSRLTIGSLFAGIGGLELGIEKALDARTVWQVEIEPFCRSVLARHWPDANRSVTDVKKAGSDRLCSVDIICGGFPCQDLSVAGSGAGMEGSRSGLWREFARVVSEISPRAVVIENTGSAWKRWVPVVRRELCGLGYASVPLRVRAVDVGAPHRRSRVFIIAHTNEIRRDGRAGSVKEKAGRNESQNGGHLNAGVDPDWQAKPPFPPVCRVDDGSTPGMDRARLRSLGNAVVPRAAELVGRELAKAMTEWQGVG